MYIVNPRHDGEENDTDMAIKFQALASRIKLIPTVIQMGESELGIGRDLLDT